MRSSMLLIAVLAVFVLGGDASRAGDTPLYVGGPAANAGTTNVTCPVTVGEAVDPDIFVEYEGSRVYFCCRRCRSRFMEDPTVYLANLPRVGSSDTEGPTHQADDQSEGHDQEQNHDENHDHDLGMAPELTPRQRLLRFAGKFHPVAVHFPIALLVGGFGAAALGRATGRAWLIGAVRTFVVFAAPLALVAAALGWAAAWQTEYSGSLARTLAVHRWLGSGSAFGALGLLVLERQLEARRRAGLWILVLAVAATAIGVTGHFGAMLVYGTGHFSW